MVSSSVFSMLVLLIIAIIAIVVIAFFAGQFMSFASSFAEKILDSFVQWLRDTLWDALVGTVSFCPIRPC